MQPLPPDFLIELAKRYELSEEQQEAFVARFSTSADERKVAEVLSISESALGSRMSGVYNKFSISGKGPGKFRKLHDVLLKEFQKNNPSKAALVENVSNNELDDLVREVRDRCSRYLLSNNNIWLYNRKHIELDQLFVPVFVLQEPKKQRESRQSPPPEPAMEVINRHQYLLILGKPGAGKSTLATHLATACCRDESVTDWIPVLLRCSEFDANKSLKLIDELGIAFGIEPETTQQILKSGKVFLILDGLDEVSSQFRQDICQELTNLVKNPYANKIVITCRTDLQDYKLSSTFERIEIVDFDESQQNQFIENWFDVADKDSKSWLAIRLQQRPECTSQILINQIQHNDRLRELAKTPILLSWICLVYVSDGKLPEKRSLLYERGLQILLEDWDRDRDIKNRVETESYKSLSSDNKFKILAELARYTFDQAENAIAFEQTKALEIIAKYQNCSQQESLEILEGIAADHGLVFRSTRRTWEFSHLTFQEYFVAQWFAQHQDWETLAQNVCNPRWREVFFLAVEIINSSDNLITLMKRQIDEFLVDDDSLQNFLHWTNVKVLSVNAPYKRSATRVFYFENARNSARGPAQVLTLAAARNLDHNFSLALNRNLELDCDLDLSIDLNLEVIVAWGWSLERLLSFPNLDLAYAWFFDLTRRLKIAIEQANKSDFQLRLKLDELASQLPNNQEEGQVNNQWWQENGKNWTEQVQALMIEHRNVGHDWQFNNIQKRKLQQYYDANKLLVDCLQSDNVSADVRQEIEETLLLPLSELEQRRKPE